MRSTAVLAVLVLAATAAVAQAPARVASAQTRAQPGRDSARALGRARSAQAEFERVRFGAFPWVEGAGAGGSCDEIVGRFCIWHEDEGDDEDWVPPPEPSRVRTARDRLITRLAEAAAVAPGDAWVAGQRVRYLLEGERGAEALAAARACHAERWWCLALEGFVLHRSNAFPAAESAFDAALAAMPQRQRAEWTSLQPLLRPGEGGGYGRTRGAERAAAERRFWWLSDPLWMDSANDRRTEHLSRWVWDRLQDRSRTTERIAWGEDLEQLVVRYGWPVGWERIRPELHHLGGPANVVTHYAPRAREFTPLGTALREQIPLRADTWDLDRARARTDYAPAYVSAFDSLPHQVAVFRRGDEAVVVAGYQMDRDSVRAGDRVEAGVVLAVDDSMPMQVERGGGSGPVGAVRIATTLDSAIISVETLARERRRAARARYPLALERPAVAGVGVSDVLLLADPGGRPRTLDDAWRGARGSLRYRPGERVGLFWEVYRSDPRADTLRIAVSLARKPAAGLRGVVERIGLAGGASPVRVRWSEEAPGSAVLGRALGVQLPARLAPGEYFLELTVQPGSGPPVTRTRSIFIER